MLRSVGKPLLAVGATATIGSAVYYYGYHVRRNPKDSAEFQLSYRVRDSSGRSGTATTSIPYLSEQTVNEKLGQLNTQNSTIDPLHKRKWSWHTAQLNSNEPIEDALAYAVVEKPGGDGNLMLFSVMDGHGGPWTSRLLSKVLIPAVALELGLMQQSPGAWIYTKSGHLLENLKSLIKKNSATTSPNDLIHQSDAARSVVLAVQRAFYKVDREIINGPLRLLKKSRKELTDDPEFSTTFLPARSGSCALLAIIDTGHDDLYVASTGDCRAIAGYIEPLTGTCIVEELTEDQTGRNPNEIARIRSEHPPGEAESVIKRGRILGGLEPSRAFGDARYKWSKDVQARIAEKFNGLTDQPLKPPPADFKTPPYVTCKPELSYRKLALDGPNPGGDNKPILRFLVLATDGLWDELGTKEVAALVSGHLDGLKGSILKSAINIRSGTGLQSSRYNTNVSKPNWTFEDDNIAAHLIRNAFGNTKDNANQLRKLLSIQPPLSRRFRDDTSVLVLWWEAQTDGSD